MLPMDPSVGERAAAPPRFRGQPMGEARQRLLRQQRRLVNLEPQFPSLLLTTLLPVLLLPITANRSGPGAWLIPAQYTLLILQSIRTLPVVRPSRWAPALVMGYRLLGGLAAAGLWVPVLNQDWASGSLRLAVLGISSLFALTTSVRLVRLLARVPRVNLLVMAGAAAGYLYLGLTGGLVATAIQMLRPGSFSLGLHASHELLLDRLTYFSFVTLGGLGYGDVLPANAVGERFAVLLSVASTLYVALLVGLLLGRFIATEQLELEVEALVDEVEEAGRTLESRLDSPGPPDPEPDPDQ